MMLPPVFPPMQPAVAPWITRTLTIYPEHLDISGGVFIMCDKGVSDLSFTKADTVNEWHLYVTCNGSKRAYKLTIQ